MNYNVINSKNFLEITMKKTSPRENVRVDDILKVDYRKVSHENYNQYESNPEIIFKNTFGEPDKIPEVVGNVEGVDLELLYKLIYQANQKIDHILDILETKDTERDASAISESINISGSGMKFVTNHPFLIGDIIALRIFLSLDLATGSWINVLGKVKSFTESGAKNTYNTAVKFINLSEQDREIIIRYVFKRQRELLRLGSDVKTEDD
jgi:PilZ domain